MRSSQAVTLCKGKDAAVPSFTHILDALLLSGSHVEAVLLLEAAVPDLFNSVGPRNEFRAKHCYDAELCDIIAQIITFASGQNPN